MSLWYPAHPKILFNQSFSEIKLKHRVRRAPETAASPPLILHASHWQKVFVITMGAHAFYLSNGGIYLCSIPKIPTLWRLPAIGHPMNKVQKTGHQYCIS